jgi:hypothetical protein
MIEILKDYTSRIEGRPPACARQDRAGHAQPIGGGPRSPRSSLDRGTRSPATSAELDALRARAWHQHGVAALAIADITDAWLRQALINEATRRWGARKDGDRHG